MRFLLKYLFISTLQQIFINKFQNLVTKTNLLLNCISFQDYCLLKFFLLIYIKYKINYCIAFTKNSYIQKWFLYIFLHFEKDLFSLQNHIMKMDMKWYFFRVCPLISTQMQGQAIVHVGEGSSIDNTSFSNNMLYSSQNNWPHAFPW